MTHPTPDSLLEALRIWEERPDDWHVSSLRAIRAMLHEDGEKVAAPGGEGFHRSKELSMHPDAVRQRKMRAERKAVIRSLGC